MQEINDKYGDRSKTDIRKFIAPQSKKFSQAWMEIRN